MTTPDIDVPVLVVGAGSVGLSIAAELGFRNIRCLTVERSAGLNPHPRANAVANRTMEYYRRWGVDEAIAITGLPMDMPARYIWVSALFGRLIHEVNLPSSKAFREKARGGYAQGEQSWSPYLKTTTGQNEVEAVLLDYVRSLDGVDLRFGTELTAFEDHGGHVRCTLLDLQGAEERQLNCRYLVACDGGRSMVRETSGVPLTGRASMADFISIYFRAPELFARSKFGNANICFPLHRDYRGFLLNWDGVETFTYHLILKDGQAWPDVDPIAAIRAVTGDASLGVEVLSTQPWSAHALTAQNYRASENVFLAGDAAHLFTPTGGFGMNTGVSDAIDIAWKLQAAIEGWAGPALLDSYSIERRPIGVRNTMEAAHCFDELFAVMQRGDEIDAEGSKGETLRAELAAAIKEQEKLVVSSGTLLGYRYENSPIIVPDGSPPTADDQRNYQPTARPGHRAPHVWLDDGSALMDHFGAGFTLLACGEAANANLAEVEKVASGLRIPISICRRGEPAVKMAYAEDLTLVRPDLMVAWRSSNPPIDWSPILKKVTGHQSA